jgi:hypothetical protein
MPEVSESTIKKRINRRLAHEYLQLHKRRGNSEGGRMFWSAYYLTCTIGYPSTIELENVDIEELGREWGALGAEEVIKYT